MKKKPTLRSLKNKARKIVSEYVRRKDADAGGTTYFRDFLDAVETFYASELGVWLGQDDGG